MSVKQFSTLLNEGKNDKKWFPKWLRRYASTVSAVQGNLPVTEAEVIQSSRSLLDHGTPAWQRLQAVRAVDAYRNLVLQSEELPLRDMHSKR